MPLFLFAANFQPCFQGSIQVYFDEDRCKNSQMINSVDLTSLDAQVSVLSLPREDNKLRVEDHAAHDWYRFILSFPAHLVRTYVDRFSLDARHTVLDPFCGTGTTLVECKKRGIPSFGIEPNPMAAFASRTKVDWETDPEDLITHAAQVANIVLGKYASEGIEDEGALPLFQSKEMIVPKLKKLTPDLLKLLLTDSISPLPLHKTLVLLETLEENKDERV